MIEYIGSFVYDLRSVANTPHIDNQTCVVFEIENTIVGMVYTKEESGRIRNTGVITPEVIMKRLKHRDKPYQNNEIKVEVKDLNITEKGINRIKSKILMEQI